MSVLSEKQQKFLEYVMRKLGFSEGEIWDKFQEHLHELIESKKKKKVIEIKVTKLEKFEENGIRKYREVVEKTEIEARYTLLDKLIEELNLKEKRSWHKKDVNKSPVVSATDLANYTFCPISYSIANTFQVENTDKMNIGTQQHEKFHLLNFKESFSDINFGGIRIDQEKKKEHELLYLDDENIDFFELIKRSKLIYSGHSKDSPSYFFNEKRDFVGQPDYIFEDDNGIKFIIEEKFKFSKENYLFTANHKVQLMAYLLGLEEFKPQYGYLVYWFYQRNSYNNYHNNYPPFIAACKVLKIERNENHRTLLNDINEKICNLKKGDYNPFNPLEINPKKCANCSVNAYCGHKTGRFAEFNFPYHEKYLKTFYVKYEK